ncbi:MAG TPA: DUF2784 family protein [Candidatus Paceibacterota bacterium]
MRSLITLAVHTILFFSFAIGSIVCSFILVEYPGVLAGKTVVIGFIVIALFVLGSWPIYGGACPFTVWENNFRKRERKKPYKEACINHYAQKWFSIRLPKNAHTWLPIALLILPIVIGIAHW